MTFDMNLRRDFSDKNLQDINFIYKELNDVYHIQNIYPELECYWEIVLALYYDIQYERCNYRCYIKEGMDARFMMELRKCILMVLPDEFYTIFDNCKTADEVLQTRIHYIKTKLYDQYEGWDWQTWHYIMHCWGRDHNQELEIDFESCFNDGIPEKEKDSELYKRQWMSAHMPETWEEAIDYMN